MNTQATGETRPHPTDFPNTADVKRLKQSLKLKAPLITNRAEQEAAQLQAYQAIRAKHNELSESFSVFMAYRNEPTYITNNDCLCVILDAEELIRRVKAFQRLNGGAQV